MPQVLLKALGAQSRHVRARRHVRALRRSCLESLQKLCVCSMSATVPPSQLLAGRVMLSVATALLLSAAASVMGAAPAPPPRCASPRSLSHAPPVPDKPVGLAAGEVAPMPPAVSCTALAVLRRPHWLTRLRAGAAAVRAGARAGCVWGGGRGGQAAGERSVPPELRAVLRSRARGMSVAADQPLRDDGRRQRQLRGLQPGFYGALPIYGSRPSSMADAWPALPIYGSSVSTRCSGCLRCPLSLADRRGARAGAPGFPRAPG